jgi:hypothetical protein
MSDSPDDASRVGHAVGAFPVIILLGALFLAVLWWIEPVRYHVFRAAVQVHPAVAERALHDESNRIVMLGCTRFEEARRAGRAGGWERARPELERSCTLDIQRSSPKARSTWPGSATANTHALIVAGAPVGDARSVGTLEQR